MSSYLLSPTSIVTGAGCGRTAAPEVASLGTRAFVLGGSKGLAAAASVVEAIQDRLPHVAVAPFRGECTEEAIADAARKASDCDLIIGVGGGKAIDTAKAAAAVQGIACVTIPTSSATCAAYTPLSIIHDARGGYVESRRLPRPVALLIQDPELMIGAPSRLLSAGCVDALARVWDTKLAARIGIPTAMAALSVAVCDQLWEEAVHPLGPEALASQQAGSVTAAFTSVVDACILGAGLAGQLGARFFGRSFSHALGYALAGVVDNASVLHGQAVGLGILVQCMLDAETPVSVSEMLDYFRAVDAPATFAALGVMDLDRRSGRELAAETHRLLDLDAAVPFPVTIDSLHRAMLALESMG